MRRRADDPTVQHEERDERSRSKWGDRIDRFVTWLGALVVVQVLTCGVLLVVSLLAGPSDWIRPPSFFVQYSLQILPLLVPFLLWIVWDAYRFASERAAERQAGGPPGRAAADS